MTPIATTGKLIKRFTVGEYVLNLSGDKLPLARKKLGKFLFPGGHVDENETPQSFVVREMVEETGIKASLVPVLAWTSNSREPWTNSSMPLYR